MTDHISKEEFWFEFFGMFGRDLGNPDQWFTDNPQDIIEHEKKSREEKTPCFISVQPKKKYNTPLGIEKLFFDWDFGKKSQNLSDTQIRKHQEKLKVELCGFLNRVTNIFKIVPLIVKTRKGYHVYIYFDKIYEIDWKKDTEKFWKLVYQRLQEKFVGQKIKETKNGKKVYQYKYLDSSIIGDVNRLSRLPMSIHEKSGKLCPIVDNSLSKTKIRGLSYYRNYGMKVDEIIRETKTSAEIIKKQEEEREKKKAEKNTRWEDEHGYIGKIRPCFRLHLEGGEMCHQERLALALEAYYAGNKDEESLVEIFRPLNDFDGDNPDGECRKQVKWFFENKIWEQSKPYTCDTIEGYGWCLRERCARWRRLHGGEK